MEGCKWCIPDNEVCGTCRRFFGTCNTKCAAGAQERGCFYYEPFGFCPKCGRDLRGGENDGKSNG